MGKNLKITREGINDLTNRLVQSIGILSSLFTLNQFSTIGTLWSTKKTDQCCIM